MSSAASEPLAQRIERLWGAPDWRWHLVLRPLAALHRALLSVRRLAYARHLVDVKALPVPVIVVGNRVAGGAGKTPTTLAVVQGLKARGWKPGIVSRGYASQARGPQAVETHHLATDVGDEPLLMARRTGVPVWVGRDRVAAGQALCTEHPEVDVIVCDDGLQHWHLDRDVELVVFDERGAGNGHLLPAGPLRESIMSPARAPHQWIVYNAASPSTELPGLCVQRRLAGLVRLEDWWAGQPAAMEAVEPLRQAYSGSITASAGIGQPQRFFDALRDLGLQVQPWPLPDHARLDPPPWPVTVHTLIVTEKDAIKLPPQWLRPLRPKLQVWVAPMAFELPDDWLDRLSQTLHSLPPRR
jgi:tetraacyldisaccharide 4'-kinase